VFDNLPQSLPALTALATVIAAGIGAMVALAVAAVNAWSARRIAIETAHREFRSELAKRAVDATRLELGKLYALEQLALARDRNGWRTAVAKMQRRGLPLKVDLRMPHDPVFAEAITMFRRRREQFRLWLLIKAREEIPEFGLTEARSYLMEAAEIVQIAAEGYVFSVRKPRERARRLLKEANPLPLKKRIDDKLAKYEALEDGEKPDPRVEPLFFEVE
jgi:hypothetical protein